MANRRIFLKTVGLSVGAVATAYSINLPAVQAEGHMTENQSNTAGGNVVQKYLNPKTSNNPYFVSENPRRPHIFFITADMISPDTYLPSREISKYVKLDNIDARVKSLLRRLC